MTADLEVPYGCGSDAWRDWAENLVACRALGLHCRSIASGEVEMVMDEALYDLNPNGAVHGGLVANAANQVMGVAVTGALPAGQVAGHLDVLDGVPPARETAPCVSAVGSPASGDRSCSSKSTSSPVTVVPAAGGAHR